MAVFLTLLCSPSLPLVPPFPLWPRYCRSTSSSQSETNFGRSSTRCPPRALARKKALFAVVLRRLTGAALITTHSPQQFVKLTVARERERKGKSRNKCAKEKRKKSIPFRWQRFSRQKIGCVTRCSVYAPPCYSNFFFFVVTLETRFPRKMMPNASLFGGLLTAPRFLFRSATLRSVICFRRSLTFSRRKNRVYRIAVVCNHD